jgi:hypothetical protein
MPINTYLNSYENDNEQNLIDDLIVECNDIFGVEMMYVPRILVSKDELYTESDVSEFRSAHAVPVFIESVEGFKGDGNYLSRFGIEIRDQLDLSIPIRTFQDEVATLEDDVDLNRPREGDLIYFPQRDACFQIMFVDKRQLFYPLGTLYLYKMVVELFEYSGERFSTGIESLDALEQLYSPDLTLWAIHNEDGDYWIDESNNIIVSERYGNTQPEPWIDNEVIQDEANDHVVQSDDDPWTWGKA